MLKDDIKEWLEKEGSYRTGLDLYRHTGVSGAELKRFEKVLSYRFVPSWAKEELQTLLQKQMGTWEVTVTAAKSKAKPVPDPGVEPDIILSLRQKGRMLKKRESFLHAELVLLSKEGYSIEQEERLFEIAKEIVVDVEMNLDEVYDAIREWENEGELPISNKEKIIQETIEKMKKRDTIRSRIYLLRGRLKKSISEEERRQYKKELDDKEKELEALETDLGIIE